MAYDRLLATGVFILSD